jgi:hypothetical protein
MINTSDFPEGQWVWSREVTWLLNSDKLSSLLCGGNKAFIILFFFFCHGFYSKGSDYYKKFRKRMGHAPSCHSSDLIFGHSRRLPVITDTGCA